MWGSKRQQSDSDPDGTVPPRRRGWGPFSGGQLTAIILGIAIAIAFPVGAWAVTGSSVNIVDPVAATHKAKVNIAGQLATTAAVSGAVTATETPPNSTYNTFGFLADPSCGAITAPVPAGKALVVTSVKVWILGVTAGPVESDVEVGSAACGDISTTIDAVLNSGAGTQTTQSYDSKLVIKAGHHLDVDPSSGSGDAFGVVFVRGYLVSSTMCTVTGPPVGCY